MRGGALRQPRRKRADRGRRAGKRPRLLAAQQAERDELAASHKAMCAERDGPLGASASLERQLASARLSGEEAADAKEGAIGRLGACSATPRAPPTPRRARRRRRPTPSRRRASRATTRARCRRAPKGWPGRPSGRAPRSTRRARRRCGRRRRAARRSEAALAEARAAREAQHAAALEACGLQTSAEAAQAGAAEREDEVAQLVSRLDAAREELGAKLRAAQRALQDEDAEAEAHAEGREAAARLVAERDATVAQLRHVLGSVSHTSQNPSILPSCHVHGTV